jgi:hypothetical protein
MCPDGTVLVPLRHVARRARRHVLPAAEGLGITAAVFADHAEGKEDAHARPVVRDLPADGGSDANDLLGVGEVGLPLDGDGQPSLQDDVDLLLPTVAVDPPGVTRLQCEQIDPEAPDPKAVR